MKLRFQDKLFASVCLLLINVSSSIKSPIVKWGQKSGALTLTLPLLDVVSPDITLEEKSVHFRGFSKGEEYKTRLKLLRPINVSASTYGVHETYVVFDLVKKKREPCWKRLLRSKKNFVWLKKDHDQWDYKDCQNIKWQWRETYFTAKLQGREVNVEDASPVGERHDEVQLESKRIVWQNTVEEYRSRAVPRPRRTSGSEEL
uniref:CS domain-containing protein n=1 Tax=Noctiluca scintillans TaxID=2966 RepID=A0A7S1ACR7_NOCSC|mmetsp:Transcript_4004/g.11186  ORF Transcript_4004/g.11186 Transcript_4004/m.11186 type:complete len:202 (+) Transcript_4004:44-649(+)